MPKAFVSIIQLIRNTERELALDVLPLRCFRYISVEPAYLPV